MSENEYYTKFLAENKEDAFSLLGRRYKLCRKYSWAIPDNSALDTLGEYSPLVEIGSGGGYWAYLLRKRKVDILTYDIKPGDNHWVNNQWTNINKAGPWILSKVSPKRTLFLCWPPYNTNMSERCLDRFRGNTIIYIGKGMYGCTGTNKFHRELDNNFNLIKTQAIPQWPGMHDQMYVYLRQ